MRGGQGNLIIATAVVLFSVGIMLWGIHGSAEGAIELNQQVASKTLVALRGVHQMQFGVARVVSSVNELLLIRATGHASEGPSEVEMNDLTRGQMKYATAFASFQENYEWLSYGRADAQAYRVLIAEIERDYAALMASAQIMISKQKERFDSARMVEEKEDFEDREQRILARIDELLRLCSADLARLSATGEQSINSMETRSFVLAVSSIFMILGYAAYVRLLMKKNSSVYEAHLASERELAHLRKIESLGVLAGGMAHELNNQLQPVLSMSELTLSNMVPGDPNRRKIELVSDGAKRAKETVSRILAFARNEKEQGNRCEVAGVLRGMRSIMEISCPSKIELQVDGEESIGMIDTSSTSLECVVINLFNNAIQAMEGRSGILRVHYRTLQLPNGAHAEITVQDHGKGIPREHLKRIFEPFFTTKEVGQGTGLGLSQTSGIVKGLGGSIAVESQVGEGTTFVVRIPLTTQDNSSA